MIIERHRQHVDEKRRYFQMSKYFGSNSNSTCGCWRITRTSKTQDQSNIKRIEYLIATMFDIQMIHELVIRIGDRQKQEPHQ